MSHLHSLKALQLIYGLAFVALIVLTGIVGTAGLIVSERGSQEAQRLSAMVGLAERARGDLYRQLKEVFDFHFLDDPDARAQYRDYSERLSGNFTQLSEVAARPEEVAAIERLVESYQAVRRQTDGIMAYDGGTVPEADRLSIFETELEGEGLSSIENAFVAAEELLLIARDTMAARTAGQTRTALLILIVPLGLSAAMLLIARVYLQRAFIRPLSGVLDTMAAFGGGSLERRVPVGGAAEMVTLQNAINRMATDLSESRAALLRSEKQAALGALVPVIAHNIRNPLASIRAMAQVSQAPDLPTELQDDLQSILGQVDRLETWLESLLSYLDTLNPQFGRHDFGECVANAVELLKPQLAGKDVVIELDAPDDVATVEIDGHLVEQAVYGLIANAVDASPPGGRIRFQFGGDAKHRWVHIDDQGPGLPFVPDPSGVSPGPTTKTMGSGIGIPFAFKVCELHNGTLAFGAAPDGGARVTMTLPANRNDT